MRLLIVSGLSGSGKSVALHMLEDLGYYCIDNIPARLLQTFVAHTLDADDPSFELTAVGVDARNRPADIEQIPALFDRMRAKGIDFEVLFLHADEGVLLKRYSETRRKHPLSGGETSLIEAIKRERKLLEPLSVEAQLVIDTTRSSIHELREVIRERVARKEAHSVSLQFESFGFKAGVPAGADFVFDVRCLPNPYWEPGLREFDGRDATISEYLSAQPEVNEMFTDIVALLEKWIPRFERGNRSYLTVAIGCTGGRHRSVYLAERLAAHFAKGYPQVLCHHNQL